MEGMSSVCKTTVSVIISKSSLTESQTIFQVQAITDLFLSFHHITTLIPLKISFLKFLAILRKLIYLFKNQCTPLLYERCKYLPFLHGIVHLNTNKSKRGLCALAFTIQHQF